MKITAFGATDIGQRRDENEDAFSIDRELRLFIVCDGMGGHAAGEVASKKTAELITEHLRKHRDLIRRAHSTPGGYFKVVELAETAAVEACRQLYTLASSQAKYAGMGTTMTMLIVVDNKAVMCHVGDSRLYLVRDDKVHLLSNDHTLANELLQSGKLTPEQFPTSPFHNVLTRSVGNVEGVESEMLLFDLLPDDTFLLCSDGLSNYIENSSELMSYLQKSDLSSVPGELVQLANQRGGKDNITAVVIRVDPTDGSAVEETRTKSEALQSLFLCEDLSYSRLIRLVEISELRAFDRSAQVLGENEPCEGLFVIVQGHVQVSRQGETLGELRSGDCFCETGLVLDRKAKGSVQTLAPTTVLIVPRKKFLALTRRFSKMGRVLHTRLLRQLAKQIDEAIALI